MRFPNPQCLDHCCLFLYLFIQGFINTKTNSISVILLSCGYNLELFLYKVRNEVRILNSNENGSFLCTSLCQVAFEALKQHRFWPLIVGHLHTPFYCQWHWVLSWRVSEKHQHLRMVSRPDFTSQFKVCWSSSHLVGWEDEDASASSFWQPIIHFQAATMPSPPLNALPQCSFNPQRAQASGTGQDWMNKLVGYINRLSFFERAGSTKPKAAIGPWRWLWTCFLKSGFPAWTERGCLSIISFFFFWPK